ncbi:triose-phosphate isomerase [Sphingomonas sanguinis]|uniref:triose-phosphate isomerase n=1 Tax=Sphingomonas sanguinis TaxID=33051 RepID=UPI001C577879|nr:triose-phosphate isomerase [Sphingomonas sanguinis]QXT35748.1 triose-phosphate isomerase [Sphingomonas sanguinis]
MAKRPLLVGNWKMHGDGGDLAVIVAIGEAARRHPAVDVALCVPATLIDRAQRVCPGLAIGGQDCHAEPNGAHTGDISATMLREAGASLVLLGHSERRHDHHEGDALIAAKLRAARAAGLEVVLCVGETAEDHAAGRSAAVVREQLSWSLAGADAQGIAIAYEPVWAIGGDITPDPVEVATMAGLIRDTVSGVRVLYGGSVTPDNGAALFAQGGIDGFLVGRQSLEADAFTSILKLMDVPTR